MNGFVKIALVIVAIFVLAMAFFFKGNGFSSMKSNFSSSQSLEESMEVSK